MQTVQALEQYAQFDLSSWVTGDGFVYGDITSVSVSPDGSKPATRAQAAVILMQFRENIAN